MMALLTACASNQTKPVPEGYYRVQAGDTLYRIAKRYGQNVQTLAAWNNLPNSSKIEVGQVLRVRRNAAANPSASRSVMPVNRLQLQWPADNGSNSIIQRYNGVTNKGIDISGYRGQTVKAAAAGQVIYVGEGVRGYGKLILISHNTSTITAYAHNDNILVQKDQNVSAGQPIGNMGSTDSGQVKLHFEVRINGKAVDPMTHLPR
nr:peptidoglycan DD-metalloendopeptidase family protein [Neisseria weixii]